MSKWGEGGNTRDEGAYGEIEMCARIKYRLLKKLQ